MEFNPAKLDLLDKQAESERDRHYGNRTTLKFDFDENRCDHSFKSHLPLIARLCERLGGEDNAIRLDLTQWPTPQRSTWGLIDQADRGLIFHHDKQVQGNKKEGGEYIDFFWTTVGLPHAFAACYLFGRYLLAGRYDLYLTPTVEVESNLPESAHFEIVKDFADSMHALGFPLTSPLTK